MRCQKRTGAELGVRAWLWKGMEGREEGMD